MTSPFGRPANLAGTHSTQVRRLIDAPRAQVFEMWTTPDRMGEWLTGGGPVSLDVRVGGRYHLDMHYQGKSYDHEGEYLEITPPSRLVFTWISQSTNRKPSIVTVEFFERGDQTELVLTHEGLPDAANAEDHRGGWTEILDWLASAMTTA